jgi:hypothetical protein
MRKKQTAEKLEQDKQMLTAQKSDLEGEIVQLENMLHQERQQWMLERQQYEQYVQQLSYERDEAIRTKTLETTELRRMNNILKDTVRDLERHQDTHPFSTHEPDAFTNDFNDLRNLGLDDTWDDGFSLINADDKMEESDTLQRQATPKPTSSSTMSSTSSTPTKSNVKVGANFSVETVAMCMLMGALWVTQIAPFSTAPDAAGAATSVEIVTPNMPVLAEEYRTEAGNMLQALLASDSNGTPDALSAPVPSASGSDHSQAMSGISSVGPRSSDTSLDSLHASLVAPSRRQQAAAAFSLSAASYNHINSPDCDFDDDEVVEIKPTKLQQLFANMQAERDGQEKIAGFGSKARERSVLLDRVPEKVLRDFREMIAKA